MKTHHLPALFFVLMVTTVSAAPKQFALEVTENVWDVATEDLDENGVNDLLIVTCDEKSYPQKKQVAVFLAAVSAEYSTQPSFTLPLAPSISTLFLAECDAKPPKELVALDAAGATVLKYSEVSFETIAEPRFSSLLPSGSKEPIFLKDASQDVNGDGIEEWLIPMPSGYSLRTLTGEVAFLACDVVSEIRRVESIYISHRLPACHFFDFEGSKGVAFLSDEFADFTYGADWSKHHRFKIPRNLEEKWDATSKMDDVNKDGFPDLLVTQTKGTINLQVLTQVYIATAPFEYPQEPTTTLTNKGGIASPGLVDIDGDGNLDLVVINVAFGVKNIINLFVRGKLSVDAQVYLFQNGDFSDIPAYTTTLSLDAPEGRERVAYVLGDFDGDGRKDVAYGQDSESLAVLRGAPDRFVESKPWVTLKVPSFGAAVPFKLDANAAEDIVLFHPAGENSKRVEVIVF